jgi:hypothetical protein
MAKQAIISKPPALQGIPRVDFFYPDFDVLVWNKGYDITVEPAFPCPCKQRIQEAQSICLNCQGTGWVFGTPVQTKAIITSINKDTKYKEWSSEMIGTSNCTIEQRFQLSFMDKITILDSHSIFAENLLVKNTKTNDGQRFLRTTYPVKEVQFLFQYVSAFEPLKKLVFKQDFDIAEGIVVFTGDNPLLPASSVSIRYTHNLQYFVLDINHDVRNSYMQDYESKEVQNKLPVSAIIRRVHCVPFGENTSKDKLLNNPTNSTIIPVV